MSIALVGEWCRMSIRALANPSIPASLLTASSSGLTDLRREPAHCTYRTRPHISPTDIESGTKDSFLTLYCMCVGMRRSGCVYMLLCSTRPDSIQWKRCVLGDPGVREVVGADRCHSASGSCTLLRHARGSLVSCEPCRCVFITVHMARVPSRIDCPSGRHQSCA